jgi:tRNA dimethylallyltransferase
VRAHVEGAVPLEATIDRVVIATRQYAKRQRTWFRHQLAADAVTRVDPMGEGWRTGVMQWWMAHTEASTA